MCIEVLILPPFFFFFFMTSLLVALPVRGEAGTAELCRDASLPPEPSELFFESAFEASSLTTMSWPTPPAASFSLPWDGCQTSYEAMEVSCLASLSPTS